MTLRGTSGMLPAALTRRAVIQIGGHCLSIASNVCAALLSASAGVAESMVHTLHAPGSSRGTMPLAQHPLRNPGAVTCGHRRHRVRWNAALLSRGGRDLLSLCPAAGVVTDCVTDCHVLPVCVGLCVRAMHVAVRRFGVRGDTDATRARGSQLICGSKHSDSDSD